MVERKEFRGIQTNHCQFQGTIIEDPVENGNYIFLKLRTENVVRDSNGQYTSEDQIVPLMVEPDSSAQKVIKMHVRAGRQLLAWTAYKTWEVGGVLQHQFTVKRVDLGSKPYEGPVGGQAPPIP